MAETSNKILPPNPKVGRKVPLRTIIVIPFLIQILAVVGITGWLSYRTGRKAVNEISAELANKIRDKVQDAASTNLEKTYMLNHITHAGIRSGNLNLDDFSKVGRYFWNQVIQQPPGTSFYFANEQGEFIGITREQDDNAVLLIRDKSSAPKRKTYTLDSKGNQTSLKETSEYDPRIRPWYQAAKNSGKAVWSPIYLSVSNSTLLITATEPIYEQGKLKGILAIEQTLSQISDFLRKLTITPSGEAFIIEYSGDIVATSTSEQPFINDGQTSKRLKATDSTNPLIRATARNLLEKFGSFNKIDKEKPTKIDFIVSGEKIVAHLDPLKDKHGLDWLTIVVIPEADFLGQIQANTRTTILLCLLSLMLAILFGLYTSKWIVKPILSLKTAAKKLAEGEWEQNLPVDRSDEIGELANSFKIMTEQLKESFETLEQKVKDRTADLAVANTDLEKKNLLIRKVFGRYLTDEVVANLLENPEGLKLGGERRKITILTSDIRGFTAKSEHLAPEEVIKTLNLYLKYMADVITHYQGTIDEFMGDGILVLFGAPTVREDDATRAVACAIAMQLAMISVNEKIEDWGLPPLEMGIGINTGEVVVGNIGSEKRTKYGVVGNQVNLTYRIESYTIGGQILISESTLKEVGSILKVDGQKQVQAKGLQEPITIYEVGGIAGEYNLFLSKEEQIFVDLPEEIPIRYTMLDGKHVSETFFKGSLVKLSAKGAEVKIYNDLSEDCLPHSLSNIKINLLTENAAEVNEDVYAKVLEKHANNSSFYIYFTSKPSNVKAKLDAIYKSISG